MPASSRRYPFVGFTREREVGKDMLFVTDVSQDRRRREAAGQCLVHRRPRNDKIAFVGENELAQTTMFKILMGELEPDEGTRQMGRFHVTRATSLRTTASISTATTRRSSTGCASSPRKKDDVYLRGFLGRMLFSGEDVFKSVKVLSGGEKVRCMLSQHDALRERTCILLDQPTNHLDMESIQAVNKGLIAFPGNILLASHDHEMLQSVANRIIEFRPDGTICDRLGTYDEYLEYQAALKNS